MHTNQCRHTRTSALIETDDAEMSGMQKSLCSRFTAQPDITEICFQNLSSHFKICITPPQPSNYWKHNSKIQDMKCRRHSPRNEKIYARQCFMRYNWPRPSTLEVVTILRRAASPLCRRSSRAAFHPSPLPSPFRNGRSSPNLGKSRPEPLQPI